jgi:hypothetical protein
VDPFIRFYPDAIEPSLCQSIIDKFDGDPRRHAGNVEGPAAVKRSTDLEIGELPDWEILCRALDVPVSASFRRYRQDVSNFGETHPGLLRETGYQLQCYRPGGQDGFDWHADVTTRSSAERVLAMIAYLNSIDDGGDTEFRAQALSIAPRRGGILWFPPTFPYVHRGTVPRSGPKYIITCFLLYPR